MSGENFLHHMPAHIGETKRAAVKSVSELLMIEAELVENRRVQIVHVNFVLHGEMAEFVRGPERKAGFHTPTRQPDSEALLS